MTARDQIAEMDAAAAAQKAASLTPADMEILEFERLLWKYQGKKEEACYERFGHGLTRYYARLNLIVDKPAAAVYDPPLVHRIQRLRAQRANLRSNPPRKQA